MPWINFEAIRGSIFRDPILASTSSKLTRCLARSDTKQSMSLISHRCSIVHGGSTLIVPTITLINTYAHVYLIVTDQRKSMVASDQSVVIGAMAWASWKSGNPEPRYVCIIFLTDMDTILAIFI